VNGSDKTVKVRLIAVADPYVKGTSEAAAATRKLGADMDGVSAKAKGLESASSRTSGALKGMAVGAAAVAGTGLVMFLKDSVQAAGDLQQSVGGVDAVFKDGAKSIHDFGATAAETVGLSTNEFNQLVTVTGALLKNKGLDDFTQKSLDLVKIGADLAAQFGGPTSQAVEALNAAMRGEADPIERYGISVNQTAVNAELAAKGLDKLTGKALAQAKAQATIEIIMRQSADAAGTFAREADTLQGQQQRLNAEWENAKAELGTALLPALTDVTAALRDGVDVAVAAGHAWGEIPGPVKAAIAALVIYKLTNQQVTSGLTSARDAVKRMREELALQRALAGGVVGGYQRLGDEAQVARTAGALGVASKAARGAGSALLGAFGGPVGLAIIGLTTAIGVFAQKHQEATQRVEEFTAAIKADSGELAKNTKEAAANALEKSGAAKAAKELGVNLNDLTDAAVGNLDAQKRVNDALDRAALAAASATGSYGEFAAAGQTYTMNAGKVRDAIGGTNKELADATAEYKRHVEMVGNDAGAQQDLVGTTDDTTAALKDQKKTVQDLAKEVLALSDAHISAVDAEIGYQQALDDVNAAIKENGKTATKNRKELDLTTQKGRDNAQALLEQASKAKEVAQANLEQGDSLKSLRKGMDDAKQKFIENATRMGLSQTAAEDMAKQFDLTTGYVNNLAKSVEDLPASKQIKIEAEAAAAKAELARVKKVLDGLKSKTVVIDTVTRQRYVNEQGPNGGRAMSGGLTKADGGYITGPGTSRSDSIPAWLSNGEYVIKAAAVSKYGTGLLDHINAMRFAEGGAVRYAQRTPTVSLPSPTTYNETTHTPIYVDKLIASDAADFRRRADDEAAWRRSIKRSF
jgi:hypothetical protein